MLELPVKSCAIYLNRKCVRNCPYCEISKSDKKELSLKEWKKGLENLREKLGVEFFLFLGNEPLMLGHDLVHLVRYLKENDYYYAMYSTSPRYLFNAFKNKLVRAGLKNWSSGIDFILPVYEKQKSTGWVSSDTEILVEKSKASLVNKAEDSLAGLKYMSERGVQAHALITISRMNVEFFPDMLAWFKKEMPDVHVGFSCAEWKTWNRMDFAVDREKCPEYFFTESDKDKLAKMITRFKQMRERDKFYTQIPNSYVEGMVDYGINLDWKCYGYHIPSVDCDGSFRTCGYAYGNRVRNYNVLDFDKESFLRDWDEDVKDCPGCYWAFSWIAKSADSSNELFHIENLKGRVIE